MPSKTTVVNLRDEPHDIFIGRPGKWGNPFSIGTLGMTRADVIQRYREWIVTQPNLLADIGSLRGKRLGCYCKPLPCHGDVLVELLSDKSEDASI